MKLNRREFVKRISIASAVFLPVARSLGNELGTAPGTVSNVLSGNFNDELEFHVIDNNLLNLHFYFINVKRKNGKLRPADEGVRSFMIVRLPQQHVSEAGFWARNWAHANENKPYAELSGFSYLAFHLWPDITDADEKRISFELKELLDWQNEANFDLITLVDWFRLKGARDDPDDPYQFKYQPLDSQHCDSFRRKKIWDKRVTHTVETERYEPKSDIYKKYKSIVLTFLDGNLRPGDGMSRYAPATFLELPNEACLVPFHPKEFEGPNKIKKTFWKNRFVNQDDDEGKRTDKYEIYNNSLFYTPTRLEPENDDKADKFSIETPSFRIAGLITNHDFSCPPTHGEEACPLADEPCSQPNAPRPKADDILPSFLDKVELTFLTQLAKSEATKFTDREFDIKEINGLFFTGLGAITHLRYNNVEKVPYGVDLIEYEHRITQGRDIFVKVSRLGYNSKTGQRYKHVIEGTRKITEDPRPQAAGQPKKFISFIELNQYCECIDKEISYVEFDENNWPGSEYRPIALNALHDIAKPVLTNAAHFRRSTFSRLKVIEKKRIPIDCLQDKVIKPTVCELEKLRWFWVIHELRHLDGTADSLIPLEDYVHCEYEGLDWEDATISARTPFMFIRKRYVEELNCNRNTPDVVAANYFKGRYDQSPPSPLVERRKTFYEGKKLAYSPTPKAQARKDKARGAGNTNDTTKGSKTNIIETDFVESYFKIRNPRNRLPLGRVSYVVFPQILRAKVYLDHIRDLTHKKIPSVVEFHNDFIDHGFKAADDQTKKYLNGAKLILKSTDAFISQKEEKICNTYNQISEALRAGKDKLGNLVTPDILPDTVSLDQFGITIPPGISNAIDKGNAVANDAGKLMKIGPRELLRGNLPEILGGIDLREILEILLPAENSPMFELTAMVNGISDAITSSEVFSEIQHDIQTVRDNLSRLEGLVQQIKARITTLQTEIKERLNELSKLLPNSDELKNLLKNKFEEYRLHDFEVEIEKKLFEMVREEIRRARTLIVPFITDELAIIRIEGQEQLTALEALREELRNEVTAALSLIPAGVPYDSLRRLLAEAVSDPIVKETYDKFKRYFDVTATNLNTDVARWRDNLLNTIEDSIPIKVQVSLPSGPLENLYYNLKTLEFEPPIKSAAQAPAAPNPPTQAPFTLLRDKTAAGVLQLSKKVSDIRMFITRNISGNSFQMRAAGILQQNLQAYESQLEHVENIAKELSGPLNRIAGMTKKWNDEFEKQLAILEGRLDGRKRDSALKVKSLFVKLNPYLDFLRRVDPRFYLEEYERLHKAVLDIEGRFEKSFLKAYLQNSQLLQQLFAEYKAQFKLYSAAAQKYAAQGASALEEWKAAKKAYVEYYAQAITALNKFVPTIISDLVGSNEAKQLISEIEARKEDFEIKEKELKAAADELLAYVNAEGGKIKDELYTSLNRYIDNHASEIEKVNEARNLLRLLTSIKQQDLSYTWQTTNFRDVNLGIISFKKFSSPNTTLTVNVKASTYFTPGKFPPVVEKVVVRSENHLTNFGVGFFDILTIGFNEVSFDAGSDQQSNFRVKIKDVRFDGSLSFVQKFESWLKTTGKGLILRLAGDHIELGYSLPIPSIQTPAFSFFNLSLNFAIRIFFDNRPMRFSFSFARIDSKFGIAAGIYAGFGYFGLVGEPKRGIVEIDCALEAGVWKGISIGPISGEVKLAFGFRYTRNDFGVRLEGYIVAEGRLSVWILEVEARIYLGIISENSYVEGMCTVTYSVKLGFMSKSFSGTFHQRIAGAKSNNNSGKALQLAKFHAGLSLFMKSEKPANGFEPMQLRDKYLAILDMLGEEDEEIETKAVSFESWKKFVSVM